MERKADIEISMSRAVKSQVRRAQILLFSGTPLVFMFFLISTSSSWGQNSSHGKETNCERYTRVLNEGCPRNFPLSIGAECNRIMGRYKELQLGCRDTHTNRTAPLSPIEEQSRISSDEKRGGKENRGPEPIPVSDITSETPPKSESSVSGDSQGAAIEEAKVASDTGKYSAMNGKSTVNKGIPMMEDLTNISLEAANSHLEGLVTKYDGIENMPPPIFEQYNHDLEIYSQAKSRYDDGKTIDQELYESAKSPEVRSALEVAAAGSYTENELKEESKYLDYKINLFSNRSNQLQQRSLSLNSNSELLANNGDHSKRMTGPNRNPAQALSKSSTITTSEEQKSLEKVLDSLDPNAPQNRSLSAKQKLEMAKKLDDLRNRLRKKMSEKNNSQKKDLLSDFQEELKSEKAVNVNGSKENRSDAISEILRQADIQSASPYPIPQEIEDTLRETSAEIGMLSGILELESKNLFERVSEYYQDCQKRKCVNP